MFVYLFVCLFVLTWAQRIKTYKHFYQYMYPTGPCSAVSRESDHCRSSHTLVDFDHEIISIPLIQEGLLSVTNESVHDILVNLVKVAHEKSVVR